MHSSLSIIIPTYRRPDLLSVAVLSALAQDGAEVIVVSDGDSSAAKTLAVFGDRVRHIALAENHGGSQSAAVNAGVAASSGDWIRILHDDDRLIPGALPLLLPYAKKGVGVIAGFAGAIDGTGNLHAMNDQRLRLYVERHYGGLSGWSMARNNNLDGTSTIFSRTAFDAVGGYTEGLKHAEEYDFWLRVLAAGYRIEATPVCVGYYRVHGTNKSMTDGKLRDTVAPVVRDIQAKYRAALSPKVVVSIATQFHRRGVCAEAIKRLRPQCDVLNVYAHGFDRIPSGWARACDAVVTDKAHGDYGDADKFFWAPDAGPCYFLTCDDDFIYPPDYVARIVEGIERYDRRAVVGFHGETISPQPSGNYYRDRIRGKNRAGDTLEEDTATHFLGTGLMGYWSELVEANREAMTPRNMADIHFGLAGAEQGAGFVCLRHKKGWVRPHPRAGVGIYDQSVKDCSEQTELVNQRHWEFSIAALELGRIEEAVIGQSRSGIA